MSATSIEMKCVGEVELSAALSHMADAVQNKVTRKAVNAGAEVVRAFIYARAPQKAGWIKRAVAVRTKVYKNSNTAVAVAGIDMNVQRPHRGKAGKGQDTFGEWPYLYAASVEEGYNRPPRRHRADDPKRKHRANRPAPGSTFIPAHPFVRPAYDESQDEAMAAIEAEMSAGIEREAAAAAGGKA